MIFGYPIFDFLVTAYFGVTMVVWILWYLFWRTRDLDRLGGSDIVASIEGWDLRLGHDKRGRRVITIEILTREANQDHGPSWMYAILTPAEARQLARWLRAAAGR